MPPLLVGVVLLFAVGGFWISVLIVDGVRRGLMAALAEHQRQRKQRPMSLHVIARFDVSEDLMVLRLAPLARKRLPRFRPGQFLPVRVQTSPCGPVLRRCYSIATWQRRPRYYELCIKRDPGGRVSPWLHGRLGIGQSISALSPRGNFVLDPRDGRDVILVAGGVGIAPLRAMLHYVMDRRFGQCANARLTLFYAARHRQHLCYHDEFVALEKTHPRFRFHPVLSSPDAQWQGMRGHLSADIVLRAAPNKARVGFYLCGPPAMLETLIDGLRNAGVADSRIGYERFVLAQAAVEDLAFRIEIEHGEAFWFRGHRTLLDALEAHGVPVENECRAGECGVCRVGLLEGKVQELAQAGVTLGRGEILPCCCIPKSDLKLSGCAR